MIDAATKMEQLMQKSSGLRRSTGAGILLRVLRQSLKTVGKDENRARSALAVLMIVEWCVPPLRASHSCRVSALCRAAAHHHAY